MAGNVEVVLLSVFYQRQPRRLLRCIAMAVLGASHHIVAALICRSVAGRRARPNQINF